MADPVEKAYAYVTRTRSGGSQLLVFEHRDHDAGVQVPGGTVETDETPRTAAVRELAEECGVTAVDAVGAVGRARWTPPDRDRPHRRHFFHVAAREGRDRWAHAVAADGADDGLVFECYWVPLAAASLDHGLGARLDAVR